MNEASEDTDPEAADTQCRRPVGPLLRHIVAPSEWTAMANELGRDRGPTLISLWAERDMVHMALIEPSTGLVVSTLPCPAGEFPSVGQYHPPAIRFERAIRDLVGLTPLGCPDGRPWLDHGCWRRTRPGDALHDASSPYSFLEAEGDALHQVPVGPVHAGIIEPGHFRFTAAGETIVRLEVRLGYAHKAVAALMRGATLERAAELAARVSGDTTVAYSIAFASAVEAAAGVEVPERALWLRALMLELERVANHLGDVGAICNDASFAMLHAHCSILREQVLRAANHAFGHRLMMDRVVPGGVRYDIPADAIAVLRDVVRVVSVKLPALVDLYDNMTSLQDRTAGTGLLSSELARRFGAGGYVGRASGRAFDARKFMVYPPYDRLEFTIPVLDGGDVNARVWIRLHELRASLGLVERILERMPSGRVQAPIECAESGDSVEGIALIEGFRGDIFACVRLDRQRRVEDSHLRDPSWLQWPLLEAAVEGNIIADFPLCNKSFNCSYSGHDL